MRIEAIDAQINAKVYNLYNLTKEEIAIVEKSQQKQQRNVVDISNPCDTKKTPCKKIVVQFLVIEKNLYNRLKLYLWKFFTRIPGIR